MQPVDATECVQDAKTCVKVRFCRDSSSKRDHSLNATLKMPLPALPLLLCDIFSLENTFLCLDSPVGFLLIAAVAAGVSVARNSETREEQSLRLLLRCMGRELGVLRFHARSCLRLCHRLRLSENFSLPRASACNCRAPRGRARLCAAPDHNVTWQRGHTDRQSIVNRSSVFLFCTFAHPG